MVALHLLEFTFREQALIQGMVFFTFAFILAFGVLAVEWMRHSSKKDCRAIGGVRKIQKLASALRIAAMELPESRIACKADIEKIFDDVNCMAGSGSDEALAMEAKIVALLTCMISDLKNDSVDDEHLAKAIKELRLNVSMRKSF